METELLSLYINEQYYDNKIKYWIRTIYIIFREKAATLISFSVKVFLLKFIVMLFFLLPFHFNLDNPTREGEKKKEERKLSCYYGKLRFRDRSETDIRSESMSTTHFYVLSNCQLEYNRDISMCQSIEFWLICPLALITLSIYVATPR